MSYPLGIDNPIVVKQVMGSTNWALYWREDWIKIGTFSNQFTAMGAGANATRYTRADRAGMIAATSRERLIALRIRFFMIQRM